MESSTLAALVAKVRYLADVEGQTIRYPTALLESFINDAYRAYYELVGGLDGRALREVVALSLDAGTDYYDLPEAARIWGVALQSSGGDWYDLVEASATAEVAANTVVRCDDGSLMDGGAIVPTGEPEFWWWESLTRAVGTGDPVATARIHIYPATTRVTPVHVTFNRAPQTLDASTDAAFPVPGGIDYVVRNAVMLLHTRDGKMEELQTALLLAEKAEQQIRSRIHHYTGGVSRRRDTRGERELVGICTRWPWLH